MSATPESLQKFVTYAKQHITGDEKGLQQGEATLILRLLAKRFGEIDPQLQEQVRSLSIEQLESLGEMLLDFGAIANLVTWLDTLEQ